MSSEQADKLVQELDEKQIIDYLRHHADFFNRHLDLLSELELPHNTGAHASLIERQVDLLREQRSELKQRLDQLLATAHENESLSEDLHQAQLLLMDAETLEEVFELVDESMQHEFDADAIAIRLIHLQTTDLSEDNELIILDDHILPYFERMMMAGNPSCELLDEEHLYYLFGENAADIASNVVIPLRDNEVSYGLLAIGSTDPERYTPEMGTIFLRRYGEFLAHLLKQFLQPEPV